MRNIKKAEDLLMEDKFLQKQQSRIGEEEQSSEFLLAKTITKFFKSLQIVSMPDSEKKKLRKNIETSLQTAHRKRKTEFRWVAAAILIFGLLGSVWFYKTKSLSPLERYAQNMEIPETTGESTLLILSKEKEISISEENSEINYLPTQQRIQINKDTTISNNENSLQSIFHTVIVPYGKRSHLILSDGTKVWLNSGTKFIYPATFNSEKREVYLQGEAIFDVIKNDHSHFIVNTNNLVINVVGTVFNVMAYPEDRYSSTVLERGRIELVSTEKLFPKRLSISPGTMAVFNSEDKSISSRQVNAQNYLSWRDGFLILNKEKLPSILKRLSRYYNVEIELINPKLEKETFTGSLDLKTTPQDVLTVISNMVPLKMEERNDKLIIN